MSLSKLFIGTDLKDIEINLNYTDNDPVALASFDSIELILFQNGKRAVASYKYPTVNPNYPLAISNTNRITFDLHREDTSKWMVGPLKAQITLIKDVETDYPDKYKPIVIRQDIAEMI